MQKDFDEINISPNPYTQFNLSQGISHNHLLFISGQASINGKGELLYPNDFQAQAEQAFSNLSRVLQAGQSSMDNVLKVTIFLTDMTYFATIVSLREKYFSAPYPADTIVEITGLFHPDAMIEIEAIALKS